MEDIASGPGKRSVEMNLNVLAKQIAGTSASKGFGGVDTDLAVMCVRSILAIGEVCEGIEELRDGHGITEIYYGPDGKCEGFPIEIADAIIRLLDLCARSGIDIQEAVRLKMEYNRTRPKMHGKAF